MSKVPSEPRHEAQPKCHCHPLRLRLVLQPTALEIFQLPINQKPRRLSVARSKNSIRIPLVITRNFDPQFPTPLAFYVLNIVFTVRTGVVTFGTLGFHSSAS